jgi:hypothetical protein
MRNAYSIGSCEASIDRPVPKSVVGLDIGDDFVCVTLRFCRGSVALLKDTLKGILSTLSSGCLVASFERWQTSASLVGASLIDQVFLLLYVLVAWNF